MKPKGPEEVRMGSGDRKNAPPPHPATLKRPGAPPHPATLPRGGAVQPKSAERGRPPHPATVSRGGAPPHPATVQRRAPERPPHPATVAQRREAPFGAPRRAPP